MMLVRNVFRLKFGKAREGVASLEESIAIARRQGHPGQFRLLTDLTGEFYTIVLEVTYRDLASFEQTAKMLMADRQWQAAYQTFVPLVESGRREMFTIVDT